MTAEERLARLERNNWRLTLALVLMGMAATLIVTTGMAQKETAPEKVRAGGFELVDENGKVRAGISLTKDGPQIYVSDENSKVRASLTATKGGSGLSVFDENGKVRTSLILGKDGPGLRIFDEGGKLRSSWVNGNMSL
ncbi:MAG: hypothetical protein ACLP9L_31170 [Thermoguttaceae bacterium]